jgi:hypothetical protein
MMISAAAGNGKQEQNPNSQVGAAHIHAALLGALR